MKIVITKNAYDKFMFGVMNCDKEIGYMGRVTFDKKTCTYTITNVYLPTQEITGATTDLDADSVAKCEIDSFNDAGYFNAWLHSHVNMGAFWSGTDVATIKEMGQKGLCVAIVGNKKREMKGAVYAHTDEDHVPDYFNDNVPIIIEEETHSNAVEWLAEMKANLRTPVRMEYNYGRQFGSSTKINHDSMLLTDHYSTWEDHMLVRNESLPLKRRDYVGTSNAYKKEMKKMVSNSIKNNGNPICFQWAGRSFTMQALADLSRDQVQDIIDENKHWPNDKKIELMSKWYFIPVNFFVK